MEYELEERPIDRERSYAARVENLKRKPLWNARDLPLRRDWALEIPEQEYLS